MVTLFVYFYQVKVLQRIMHSFDLKTEIINLTVLISNRNTSIAVKFSITNCKSSEACQ